MYTEGVTEASISAWARETKIHFFLMNSVCAPLVHCIYVLYCETVMYVALYMYVNYMYGLL